jgi:putative transposase
MCRGNRQEAVFKDDKDSGMFLDTLAEACGRCGWRIHAFVLMGNHYHLLLETPEANLVDGMRWFQGTYTQRFNARHKLWGHLFQGRYKALLVDTDGDYFTTVSSYVHLNPARARCFDLEHGKLADYPWSSYPLYLCPSKRPEWLVVDRVLGSCGFEDNASDRAKYRRHMRQRVLEILHAVDPARVDMEFDKIRRGWVLGSDEFRAKMLDAIGGAISGNRRDSYSGDALKLHDEQAAERLFEKGLGILDIEKSGLDKLKKGDDRKKVLAWLIRRNTNVRNETVARMLNMGHPSAVSRSIGEVDAATKGNLWKLKGEISNFKD